MVRRARIALVLSAIVTIGLSLFAGVGTATTAGAAGGVHDPSDTVVKSAAQRMADAVPGKAYICPDQTSDTIKSPNRSPGAGQVNGADAELLPIDRWGGAASTLHTRLDTGTLHLGSLPQQATRNAIAPIGLTIGNAFWQMSNGMLKFADSFDVLQKMGCVADRSSYVVASSLTGRSATTTGSGSVSRGASLVSLLVVVGLGLAFWRARRGQSPWRNVAKIGGVIGVFLVLMAGAGHTARTGVIGNGSPAWWALKTTNIASQVTGPLVDGMTQSSPGPDGVMGYGQNPKYAMRCDNYMSALHSTWREQNPKSSTIPMVMSGLWEQSGLAIWVASQFGTNNNYSQYVYCHMLDRRAGVSVDDQTAIIKAAAVVSGGPSMSSAGDMDPSVLIGNDDVISDIDYTFLAACRFNGSTWAIAPGWDNVSDDALKPKVKDCAAAWKQGAFRVSPHDDPSRVEQNVKQCLQDKGIAFASATQEQKQDCVKDIIDNPVKYSQGGIDAGDVIGLATKPAKFVWDFQKGVWKTEAKAVAGVAADAAGVSGAVDALSDALAGPVAGPDGPFNWSYSSSTIDEATNGPGTAGVADYMNNLHGYAISGALTLSIIYILVSFLMLLTFGILALSVIVAKLASLVMIMFVFFALAASLIPSEGPSRAGKFAKFWLGTTVYAYLLTAILAIMTIVTAFIAAAGTSAFGPGSVMATIWLGFAPITAVIVIHMLMKNTVGFSIFKPGAALALGAMAGSAGAAAGMGVDRLARRGAHSLRRGVGQGIGRRAVDRQRYGKGKGPGQKMAPDGTPQKKLSADERKKVREARKAEKAAQGKGLGNRLRDPLGSTAKSLGRAKVRAQAKLNNAWESFRDRPVRSIAKGLGKTVKWGAVGALGAAAPVTLPLVAGYMAQKKLRERRRQNQETMAIHGMTPREKKYSDDWDRYFGTPPNPQTPPPPPAPTGAPPPPNPSQGAPPQPPAPGGSARPNPNPSGPGTPPPPKSPSPSAPPSQPKPPRQPPSPPAGGRHRPLNQHGRRSTP